MRKHGQIWLKEGLPLQQEGGHPRSLKCDEVESPKPYTLSPKP